MTDSAHRMRNLFCVILAFCQPSDPMMLWMNHRHDMSDDILHREKLQPEEINDRIFNETLIKIEDRLLWLCGKGLKDFGLPEAARVRNAISYHMYRETNYKDEELDKTLENISKLNDDQTKVFEAFNEAMENGLGGFWFIDAPGGTGKTFLSSIMLATVRKRKAIALAVASSGIAATLLPGGRTAHATFKLPIDMKDDKPVCNMSPDSKEAEVVKECALIIWDECTMSHRKAFEAVDRLLRDITKTNEIMGGKLVSSDGLFCSYIKKVQYLITLI